jgi:hypothetical protein
MSEPRMVRCQYGRDPHPLDDECVNVTEAWPVSRPGSTVVVSAPSR